MIIFKTKTSDAFLIKIVAELLSNNIKTGCFIIDSTGIKLREIDSNRKILVDIFLEAENFSLYKYKLNTPYTIGINLNHFHKMLKTIKKKDSIQLFINDDNPSDLGIKVIPRENTRVTTSFIKILNIQNLQIELPASYHTYGKPVIVSSIEYQKLLKDMTNIGNTININSKNFSIRFQCDNGGIIKRRVEFGELEDSDDEDNVSDKVEYNQDFYVEQLSRITKIAGLSKNMQIYTKIGMPLLFRSSIGNLGKISLYIKSKEELERDNIKNDEDK